MNSPQFQIQNLHVYLVRNYLYQFRSGAPCPNRPRLMNWIMVDRLQNDYRKYLYISTLMWHKLRRISYISEQASICNSPWEVIHLFGSSNNTCVGGRNSIVGTTCMWRIGCDIKVKYLLTFGDFELEIYYCFFSVWPRNKQDSQP